MHETQHGEALYRRPVAYRGWCVFTPPVVHIWLYVGKCVQFITHHYPIITYCHHTANVDKYFCHAASLGRVKMLAKGEQEQARKESIARNEN